MAEQDLRVVLSPTGHEHDREVSLLERLMHGLTDGALIVMPEESSAELERLVDGGYRFVVVDPIMPLAERIPSVSAAHASGAHQAMRHLLELGHRRIAQITGPRGWLATEDRRRGYHAALASAGILPDPALEVEGDPRDSAAAAAPRRAAARPGRSRRRRSSPSTTTSRSARSRRRGSAGCACRRISPSSASTTSSTRRS